MRLDIVNTPALAGGGLDAFCLRHRVDSALSESVSRSGVVEPVTLEEWGGSFRVIAGFRRVAAALEAGLLKVPAVVYPAGALRDREAFQIALASNAPGTSLNTADRAIALVKARDFGFDEDELAGQVAPMLGLAASHKVVRQFLGIAGLGAAVLDALARGAISRQHAEALLVMPAGEREWFFERAVTPLRMSAGDTRLAASAAVDLASREGTTPRRVLETILGRVDASVPPAAARADFKVHLRRRLRPVLTSMEEEFAALVAKLAPGAVQVEHSPGFETDTITLTARLESTADIETLRDMLERGMNEALFERMLSLARRRTDLMTDLPAGEGGA